VRVREETSGVTQRSPSREFWRGRRVFVTGHTGFKGGWLALWLYRLEARVVGYALEPDTEPNLFGTAGVDRNLMSVIGDVRDGERLRDELFRARPEIVFHLAAQPLVRRSYRQTVRTYETNIMGTVHLFEAIRALDSVRAVVNITSDKCYDNKEWFWPYRETDGLGGRDPYSASKACAELITASYRAGVFGERPAVATARAGNVIGGGDWSEDRLIPDLVRAGQAGAAVRIRNPRAERPWQHVFEPLRGYLLLAEALITIGAEAGGAWNFGPSAEETRPVSWIVERFLRGWRDPVEVEIDPGPHPPEARILRLDSAKARNGLGWRPVLSLEDAIELTTQWYRTQRDEPGGIPELCDLQLADYERRLVENEEGVPVSAGGMRAGGPE